MTSENCDPYCSGPEREGVFRREGVVVRIVDIRETAVPIKSKMRNAYIDFSQMTVSVLALVTDVIREGKPVVGFGFNSNGRYAPSGLLRDRFIPRLRAAEPELLVDESGENLDPVRVWDVVMRNEKPGGHGERSVAVGGLAMGGEGGGGGNFPGAPFFPPAPPVC